MRCVSSPLSTTQKLSVGPSVRAPARGLGRRQRSSPSWEEPFRTHSAIIIVGTKGNLANEKFKVLLSGGLCSKVGVREDRQPMEHKENATCHEDLHWEGSEERGKELGV